MIVSFYDKDFVPLQNNASLNVSDWSLKRKAVDLDDFTAKSEPFLENINPTFVIMADDRGRYKYGAFAGIPQLNKNNQTEIEATDLKSIFKNDVFIKFSTYTSNDTVKDVFEEALTEFETQVIQNSFTIDYDLSDIASVNLDMLIPDSSDYQVINLWEDLLSIYMKRYDLYMTSQIDLASKKLIFTIKRINQTRKPLHLYEFTTKDYGKWVSSLNEAQFIVLSDNNITYGTPRILLSNNAITDDLTLRDLYPIKKKTVIVQQQSGQTLQEACIEGLSQCIEALADARYNENIEIDVNSTNYENDDFETSYAVYTKRGVFYKNLPIGVISESKSEKGKYVKSLTIGYKEDNLIVYI